MLQLNSAGHWPSRSRFGHPCFSLTVYFENLKNSAYSPIPKPVQVPVSKSVPRTLQPSGRGRCLRARARVSSNLSHSFRGSWHSSRSNAPSVFPAAFTRNWAMSRARSCTNWKRSSATGSTEPPGRAWHSVTRTVSLRSWAVETKKQTFDKDIRFCHAFVILLMSTK